MHDDEARYQTVYARAAGRRRGAHRGPAFRPCAADAACGGAVSRLAFVTLHVGAGTFQPVRVENLADHRHAQRVVSTMPQATVEAIERRARRGGRVMAVGTTTLRALESARRVDGDIARGGGETDLFHPAGISVPASSTACSPISTCRNPPC